MARKYDTETTLKILALIARGDTYKQISLETGIPITSLQDIKERNQTALATIQSKLITHQATRSRKILDKSQDLIESKLDNITKGNEDASLTELNAVSREAFNQTQAESGITTSPHDTNDLKALMAAIKDGDEVVLERIVFGAKS